MGKDRNEKPVSEKKGTRRRDPLNVLGTSFADVDKETVKNHLVFLIIATIGMKFFVILATTMIFHSFVDYFDIGTYLQHAAPIAEGQIPYIHYQIEYPILTFVPILLAFIPTVLTQSAMVFVFSFQFLMLLCDIAIVLCVYFIGLKIWNERTAFYAGLVYATAFSTAYFVMTKSDAFPTSLMMLALLFTVYGMSNRGYVSAVAGFFTKIFPAVAIPFIVFYNAKTTSLRQEILSAGKFFLIFCVVLLLPFALIKPEVLNAYLFATGTGLGIYVNTATFTLYSYLHDILNLGISLPLVSAGMYILMGAGLILLLYLGYTGRERDPKSLLVLVLCALFCLFLFTKFHSPQYIVWLTPLFALLVADDPVKIGVFYVTQALAYIEFPLMFGSYYVNLNYVSETGSAGWYATLLFFTLEYLALIFLVYLIIRQDGGMISQIKKMLPASSNNNK